MTPDTPQSQSAPISLPTGGGAIRSIGEKFQANSATGTASFTVPITLSQGRSTHSRMLSEAEVSSFTPQLALSYDSGSGNSPFGLGWSIGLPSITRKTDKGLPQYGDNPNKETDTFILSGAEDLVPVMETDGKTRAHRTEGNYDIYTYQPRTEGLFALIERWIDKTTHISHWRSISKENITSVYGLSATARIADPNAEKRIFSWLIEETWDAKGNLIRFSYKQEDGENIPKTCYEKHRLPKFPSMYGGVPEGRGGCTNTYLKTVSYGNTQMCTPANLSSAYTGDFLFNLVFDYGEHTNNELIETETWAARPDAFSNYKAGFEIRTYRLCKRILMFHQFAELGIPPTLVRSTDLEYDNNTSFTLLQKITHTGYDKTLVETFPPLEFTYTQALPATSFKEHTGIIPGGIDGQNNEWADLYSEGVSGILNMRNDAWYFKPNYGDKQYLNSPPCMEGCPKGGVVDSG